MLCVIYCTCTVRMIKYLLCREVCKYTRHYHLELRTNSKQNWTKQPKHILEKWNFKKPSWDSTVSPIDSFIVYPVLFRFSPKFQVVVQRGLHNGSVSAKCDVNDGRKLLGIPSVAFTSIQLASFTVFNPIAFHFDVRDDNIVGKGTVWSKVYLKHNAIFFCS